MTEAEKTEQKPKNVQVQYNEWRQLMVLKLELNMDSMNDVIRLILHEREQLRAMPAQGGGP